MHSTLPSPHIRSAFSGAADTSILECNHLLEHTTEFDVADDIPEQRTALIEFFNSTGGQYWSTGLASLSVLNSQMVPLGGSLSLLMESLKYMMPFLSFQSKPLGSCTPSGPNSCRHTVHASLPMHLLLCWFVHPLEYRICLGGSVQKCGYGTQPKSRTTRHDSHLMCWC